jgi:hypothetical protein
MASAYAMEADANLNAIPLTNGADEDEHKPDDERHRDDRADRMKPNLAPSFTVHRGPLASGPLTAIGNDSSCAPDAASAWSVRAPCGPRRLMHLPVAGFDVELGLRSSDFRLVLDHGDSPAGDRTTEQRAGPKSRA